MRRQLTGNEVLDSAALGRNSSANPSRRPENGRLRVRIHRASIPLLFLVMLYGIIIRSDDVVKLGLVRATTQHPFEFSGFRSVEYACEFGVTYNNYSKIILKEIWFREWGKWNVSGHFNDFFGGQFSSLANQMCFGVLCAVQSEFNEDEGEWKASRIHHIHVHSQAVPVSAKGRIPVGELKPLLIRGLLQPNAVLGSGSRRARFPGLPKYYSASEEAQQDQPPLGPFDGCVPLRRVGIGFGLICVAIIALVWAVHKNNGNIAILSWVILGVGSLIWLTGHTRNTDCEQSEYSQTFEHDGGTVAHTNLGNVCLECRNNFADTVRILRPLGVRAETKRLTVENYCSDAGWCPVRGFWAWSVRIYLQSGRMRWRV